MGETIDVIDTRVNTKLVIQRSDLGNTVLLEVLVGGSIGEIRRNMRVGA